jgi:hypothetical protein
MPRMTSWSQVAAVLLARDAGGIAQGVVQAASGLQFQHLARDHVDGRRHIHDIRAPEAARLHGFGRKTVGARGRDFDRMQHLLIRLLGKCGEYGGQGEVQGQQTHGKAGQ